MQCNNGRIEKHCLIICALYEIKTNLLKPLYQTLSYWKHVFFFAVTQLKLRSRKLRERDLSPD